MKQIDNVINYLPKDIKNVIETHSDKDKITEIRLRINRPLEVKFRCSCCFIDKITVTKTTIKEIMDKICNYSLYAYEDDIKRGFITVKGGNRVGICGKAVIENGHVTTLKNISSLNIRVANEIKGCGEQYIKYITDNKSICNTIIASPPGCGKTTLLRDIIRLLSDGYGNRGFNISVIDERNEISATDLGIPENDVGMRTDVMINNKTEGIIMALRSMAPEIIAVDEIGSDKDINVLNKAITCGCKILASIHADNLEEYMQKNIRFFKRIIILSKKNGPGTLEGIYNERGEQIDA